MIKLYNTLARKLQSFKSIKSGQVGMYTCGPTLYDWQHIGNLRTFLLTDTLRRVLQLSDYKIRNVMNITDVEDKIIAQLGGQSLTSFTDKYFEALQSDMAALNIDQPKWVRATNPKSISQMAKLIEKIMARGLAYESDGSIYLSVAKYAEEYHYGQLQSIDAEALKKTGRVETDEYEKASAQDFALWKAQKPGEPAWTIKVAGKEYTGRPGWHIECSAMSELELGQQFDIHLGGIDLLFPHHENEIAQSQAANHKLLANYWLHGEMLQVEGQKMSKSLGNIIKLKDLLGKGYEPLALRLLFLQAHYRTQMNFTWKSLEAASKNLRRLAAWADQRFQLNHDAGLLGDDYFKSHRTKILSAVQDDLGTPTALAILNEMVDHTEQYGQGIHLSHKGAFIDFLQFADDLLGLKLLESADLGAEQHELIKQREAARQSQDWSRADELRDQLLKQGLEIKDTTAGSIWSRL